MQQRRPVMLVILDGWGWREDAADNAIRQAKTPTFDRLWQTGPHGFLHTSGNDVGLPDGQMGNSEVGHLNIGAGRVVMQDLPRIGAAIASGEIAHAPALIDLIKKLKASGGTCHLHRPGLARRRAFASGPRRGAGEDSHRRRRAGAGACVHRRPRYAAAIGRRGHQAASRRAAAIGRRSPPCAAAITPWTATSAGTASRKPITPIVEADGAALSRCAGRRRRRLCQQEIRRVHRARRGRRLSRHERRRRRAVLQLPRRPRARNSWRDARSGFLPALRASASSASPPPSA